MDFIGRKKEIGLLESDSGRSSSFTLITGRRRVGKTRLIKEFFRGRKALYYLATAQNNARLLDDFSDAVATCFGVPVGYFPSWTAAFEYLVSLGEKIFVAIDEFQNILRADDNSKMEFQYIWDEVASSGSIHLILCGSHISVLQKLYDDYESPLYGRFTRRIILQPLSFDEVKTDDYRKSVESYSVLGGIPRYMEIFNGGSLEDNIREQIFESSSILFNEPEILLRSEVKEVPSYMSIMRAVANGNHKLNDIAGAVEIPATTLGPYIRKLIEVGMIKRSVPVTEKNPENSKLSLYKVGDNFTAFWFRFVYPHMSFLAMDNQAPSLKKLHDNFIDSHVSFVFEEICRNSVTFLSEKIGFMPDKVGSWWSGDVEIDVVAVNDTEKKVFVAECKYWNNGPVPHKVLFELRHKAASIKKLAGYSITFGIFSVSGFDQSVIDESDVVLIDCGKVLEHAR